MTTTVIVKAHCDPDAKEVHVTLSEGENESVDIIQDGDTRKYTVYDEKSIHVFESEK